MTLFIKKISVTMIFWLIFNSGYCQSQYFSPLKVGEKVPDSIFQYIVEESGRSKTIPKLFVLDFWTTTCPSCIGAFPKMDSLQRKFGRYVQIMLVNSYETRAEIDERFQKINSYRRENQQALHVIPSLPLLTGDTILIKFFPHVAVPHHVWISREGIVRAITDASSTNGTNISAFMKSGQLELHRKLDFADMDVDRPLFLDERVDERQVLQYSLLIKGNVGNFWHPSSMPNRYFATRKSIYALYINAARKFVPRLHHGKLIVEVKDKKALHVLRFSDKRNIDDNLYTYDFIVPEASADSLYHYAIANLNRCTEYYGRVEMRIMPAYVLIAKDNQNKLASSGGENTSSLFLKNRHSSTSQLLKNGTWDYFLAWASLTARQTDRRRVFVDETGFTENIDIEFTEPVTDMLSLKRQLELYGLDIIEADRSVEVFVLSDKENI